MDPQAVAGDCRNRHRLSHSTRRNSLGLAIALEHLARGCFAAALVAPSTGFLFGRCESERVEPSLRSEPAVTDRILYAVASLGWDQRSVATLAAERIIEPLARDPLTVERGPERAGMVEPTLAPRA